MRKLKIGDRVTISKGKNNDRFGIPEKYFHKVGVIKKLTDVRGNEENCSVQFDDDYWYVAKKDTHLLADEQKIVITVDGATTKAVRYHDRKAVASAVAVCSKDDTFNLKTGATLALNRLFESHDEHPVFTGKAVCIIVGEGETGFTVGKIYNVNKGVISSDYGYTYTAMKVRKVGKEAIKLDNSDVIFIEYKGEQ